MKVIYMQRTINFVLGKNLKYLDNVGQVEQKVLNDEPYFVSHE